MQVARRELLLQGRSVEQFNAGTAEGGLWRKVVEAGVVTAVRNQSLFGGQSTLAAGSRVSAGVLSVRDGSGGTVGRRQLNEQDIIRSRRQLGEEDSVIVTYALAATSIDVSSATAAAAPGTPDLAGLVAALDAPNDTISDPSRAAFANAVRLGINAAILTERFADASFIAGVTLLPFNNVTSVQELGVITPDDSSGRRRQQDEEGEERSVLHPFHSAISYQVTSLLAADAIRAQLTPEALQASLAAVATKNGRPRPLLGALQIEQAPPVPPPPPLEGVSVGLIAFILIVSCCVFTFGYREYSRRKRIRLHKIYIANEKAAAEARSAAESGEQREAREAAEAAALAEEERIAMEYAAEVAVSIV